MLHSRRHPEEVQRKREHRLHTIPQRKQDGFWVIDPDGRQAERQQGVLQADDVIAHRGIVDEGVNFIQKPFAVQALVAKVRQVLDAGQ